MDFKNLSRKEIVISIVAIFLFFGVSLYLLLVFISSMHSGECVGCTRVVAGMCFKYNITSQNHTEQQILISYMGGQDANDIKELSIWVNDARQSHSLGTIPGSYVVVPGTLQSDHVTGNVIFIDNRHQVFIDMDYNVSASVVKNGDNIFITIYPYKSYYMDSYYDDNLTVLLNNIPQPVQLAVNGSHATYATLPGTTGRDHLVVYSPMEIPIDQTARPSPKRYFIDTFV